MIKVGLTGGIGSGKTTIAQVFEILGIKVYYSDLEAKTLMIENKGLKDKIIDLLGHDSYTENGQLNHSYISNQIFNNSEGLLKMNAIVHPAVKSHFEAFCKLNSKEKYILKESAILFETGFYKDLDHNIHVSSEASERLSRVKKRDRLSEKQIVLKMDKQWSDFKKEALSNFIIKNNNTTFLIPQVLKIHHTLSK